MRVREAQKQATRDRVVAAARALFEQVGYEQTTVRMIAEAAGVAIGSVFTTFASKDEILNHILLDRFEALFEELDRLAPYLRGSARDRVASLLSIAYGVEQESLGLMMAHLAASHSWSKDIEAENNRRQARLNALLVSALQRGVDTGEVRSDADLEATVEVILAAYYRNYRSAWHQEMDAAAVSARMERQLDAVFAGLVPARTMVAA